MATDIDGFIAGARYVISAESVLTQKMTYTGQGLPEYIGEAKPGTASSAAGWRIKKLTYDGTNVTDVQWASSTTNFDKVWDDRSGYSYG